MATAAAPTGRTPPRTTTGGDTVVPPPPPPANADGSDQASRLTSQKSNADGSITSAFDPATNTIIVNVNGQTYYLPPNNDTPGTPAIKSQGELDAYKAYLGIIGDNTNPDWQQTVQTQLAAASANLARARNDGTAADSSIEPSTAPATPPPQGLESTQQNGGAPTTTRGTAQINPQTVGAPQTTATTIDPNALERMTGRTVTAPDNVVAREVNAPDKVTAKGVEATAVKTPQQIQAERIQASLMAATDPVRAAQVQSGIVAAAPTVQAPTIDGTTVGAVDPITGQRVDTTQAEQVRAQQLGLAGSLNDVIAGRAPSVAELQLGRALQENINNQRGLQAANSGGGNYGLAARAAAQQIAQLNAKAASDAAILRATEGATARSQLGQVLDQARGTDVATATTNANLGQAAQVQNQNTRTDIVKTQAQLDAERRALAATQGLAASTTNATNTIDVNKTNVANANDVALKNASLDLTGQTTNAANKLTTNQVNAAALNDAAARNAANSLTAQTSNASNELDANKSTAQLLLEASKSNAANDLTAQSTNSANQLDASKSTASLLLDANKATSANQLAAATATSANQQEADKTNAATTNNALQYNTGLINATDQANAERLLSQEQIENTKAQQQVQNEINARAVEGNIANQQASNQIAATAEQNRADAARISAASTFGASLIASDKRVKTDVRPEHDDEIEAMLRAIGGLKSFKYKGSSAPQEGVMAQDLEKSRAGRTLVTENPQGVKQVDAARAATMSLGVLAALNRRLERLEQRKGA